jgi:uncharacterized lipoprotein YmbA
MTRRRHLLRAASGLALLLPLAACGAPVPAIFVLSVPAVPPPRSELTLPVLDLRPVRLPDHLDSTQILTRAGDDRLVASRTGEWGERLSTGITRLIAATLATRLPGAAVTTAPGDAQPRWTVRVDIQDFTVRSASGSTLAARWSLRAGADGRLLAQQRVVLLEPGPLASDGAVVRAMARQLTSLAMSIGAAVPLPTRP